MNVGLVCGVDDDNFRECTCSLNCNLMSDENRLDNIAAVSIIGNCKTPSTKIVIYIFDTFGLMSAVDIVDILSCQHHPASRSSQGHLAQRGGFSEYFFFGRVEN